MSTNLPTNPPARREPAVTVQPPLGPLEVAPDAPPADAVAMLDGTLARIEQGAFDTKVRGYATDWHPALQVTVASWLARSWQAGVEDGRAERAEEVASYHRLVAEARAALDRARGSVRP